MMDQWMEVRHQVVIDGQVVEAETDRPLAGALVKIAAMPEGFTMAVQQQEIQNGKQWKKMIERIDQTYTAADGIFYFLDLPEGSYSLTSSVAGGKASYKPHSTKVTVNYDNEGTVKRGHVKFSMERIT